MSGARRAQRWTGALLAATLLTGCKSWEPITSSPTRVIAEQRPPSVRITDIDGREITVRRPVLRNDSIVSSTADPSGLPLPAVGVPYGDVNTLAVPRFSAVKSVALAAAVVGLAGMWARAAGGSEGGSTLPPPEPPKLIGFSLGDGWRVLTGLLR